MEPKLTWKTLPLTNDLVQAHLAENIGEERGTIMLDEKSRWGRSNLKLHKGRDGYYVRVGRRGTTKRVLGRCKVTYLDGKPTLFQFTTAYQDAFEADQDRRWSERHGVSPITAIKE